MIKKLIPAFVFLLLIGACSKDSLAPEEPINKGEKQLLSLRVDGFSQSLLPFVDRIQAANLSASLLSPLSSSSTNLGDHINTLEFKVYHKNMLVDSIRQHSDNSDFGIYENYFLPHATAYRVFVAGAMLENGGNIELKRGATTDETNIKILPEPVDAFAFHGSYIIDAEHQTENIHLKRFVGRLEVNLTEEIPNNAARIEMTIHNTAQYFMPFSEKGYHLDPKKDSTEYNTLKTILIKPEDRGRRDFSFNMYFILKSLLGSEAETSKVTIKAFDILSKEIAVREIDNVILQANKRTKLSGIIFGHYPNREFEIEINSEWDSEIPEYRF